METITITTDGQTLALETKGFKGKACKDATEQLEKLGKVLDSKKTAEFYQNEVPHGLRQGR